MTRKDAAGHQMTPTDQYRKQIGKQDWKKSKKEVKAQKKRADQKQSAMGAKEMVLVAAALCALVGGLYMLLFWYLGERPESVLQEAPS
ncbi:hypothetical protein BaRGS_00009753 [Batillaria attramentaria]|uniref:Triple QxxK/R motif-containing protein n=1 Tax=Batillaria attramentaria TaxID=370345 RepID=A0ABD0LH75_9CAEN|nr:hypothetical protein BaRGS_025170 [Batillaria attramentaria]